MAAITDRAQNFLNLKFEKSLFRHTTRLYYFKYLARLIFVQEDQESHFMGEINNDAAFHSEIIDALNYYSDLDNSAE